MRIMRTSRSGNTYYKQTEKKKTQTFVRNCVVLFDTASVKMAGKGEFIKVCISIISMNLLP